SREVLRQLRVDWPSGSGGSALPDTVSDVICKVHLKSFVEQQGLVGYDPNLDVLLGEPHVYSSSSATVGGWGGAKRLQTGLFPFSPIAGGQGSCCSIVHVVSCEEEFRQQQLDLLWRILDPGAHTALQKHLVCGPVKVTNPSSPIGANQYFHKLCVMPPAFSADEAWTEVIDTLTVAAIRFEMLSTAHRSQITLDLEDSSISTKGTKSGAFVMYNCARLATLFDTYQRAVERGTYPGNMGTCGEWLLLFNYLLPFPEVLQQAAELPTPTKGIRITANTETVKTATPLGLLLLYLGWARAQDQPDPVMPAALCLVGVQVPDTAQHGFQLLLQPGPRPGGELDVLDLQACSPAALPGAGL
uniref:DALR anticodon binding domain containing 3 n=1 Tax=Accipiter nisus TaxID=211598 RepID=A0A8B9M7X5_9AVES